MRILSWTVGIAVAGVVVSSNALAAGSGVLTGTIIDAQTKRPAEDVVVTVASPALQQEQTVVTDKAGNFRIPELPPGIYTLRLDKETYRPSSRPGIEIRINTTIRVNSEILPEELQSEEIVVVAAPPTVDVGSSTTGVHVNSDFINRLPVVSTSFKGAASRSFESLAEVAPGVQVDRYGASINGTTSPENQYVIDGVSVNSPSLGILSTPLAVDFVREANVITGGYLPEYGRAGGGQLDVVTKSGSNEFHGSFFLSTTPGIFGAAPKLVAREGSAIATTTSLAWIQSYGAELGGPILKDRLWFYVGFVPSFSRYQLDRRLQIVRMQNGAPVVDERGGVQTDVLPGTQRTYYATNTNASFIGKLTFQASPDHNVTLSVYGTPSTSGGDGTFGLKPADGTVELNNPVSNGIINGTFGALAHTYVANAVDTSLKWSAAFKNKSLLLDTTLGWHHEDSAVRGADGSRLGSGEGLSNTPYVRWQRTSPGPRSLNDFEASAATAACDPAGSPNAMLCPVRIYGSGGPGILSEASLDRYQAKSVFTSFFSGLGHHLVKAGVDVEGLRYQNRRGVSGGNMYQETGAVYSDFVRYGVLTGPDQAVTWPYQDATSSSITVGGFVQDSWSILDRVTLNMGIRYDTQLLYGADGALVMRLNNQWSPRAGVVYDPTRAGRAKLFASYARFYQNVPLEMVDRTLPGERRILSVHLSGLCDLKDPANAACDAEDGRLPIGTASNPNQKWIPLISDKAMVDPDIRAPSSDEIVIGGEYEVLSKLVVGGQYVKRYQNQVIEDMSRDEGQNYFIGNPGSGIAKDIPRAERDYDAFTIHFRKAFGDTWLAQGSYTLSYLRGNWSGLFRPENGQLSPNVSSDFDIVSLLPNQLGPLPGDHTHQIKLFAAKDFVLGRGFLLNVGASYRARSGAPTTYFGAHPLYGIDQVFILPRDSGERLPWVHDTDVHASVGLRLAKESTLLVSLDVFNVLDLQAPIAVDQRYTQSSVRPILGGTVKDLDKLVDADGNPFDPSLENPNFGNPTAYQPPRSFRISAKVTF
ncbi:TonB-dependent receptor [Polyangium sorediatum]|uniref:TonB-dependent receptor n=1 Tax=Polyangium sorediatum TaxID=889274 RepID=A0ABT6NYK4_9BACT|nr:TonB-dependent receptor [Polyangium sorediatum]MDI1433389.1 TonB-dependent receptor [Polyangium sorediatum]